MSGRTPSMEWLLGKIVDSAQLIAEVDSPESIRYDALVEEGILTEYDCAFGNNYYSLTSKGRKRIFTRE